MIHTQSYFSSLIISFVLLIVPLPLSAIAEDILSHISKHDSAIVINHPCDSYICLDEKLSNIIQLIKDISIFDDNINSPLAQLQNHIKNNYSIAEYNAVIEAIQYMKYILYENYNKGDDVKISEAINDIEILTKQINEGLLTVNAEKLELAQIKSNYQNNSKETRSFINIMQVKGLLSVNDQLVQNISAIDLSVVDEIVQNSTIISLSATDAILDNVTITTLSTTDQVINNMVVTNISVVDETVTGTLQLAAGTTTLPSLVFTGSTTSGFSANNGDLSFITNALERLKIADDGTISVNAFTSVGIVHNDSSGDLSSSLIVNNDITNTTISNAKLATISSANTAGNIVVRDVSGNFAANMITLTGAVTNNTDVATKEYVDTAISTGLVAKTPARVVSLTNVDVTTGGLLTIDGITLITNDRVLLINQTDPIENGLWLAQSGPWTRPADFANGTTAGQAYVLIISGTVNAGSSYLCNTPLAIIGTDPISFALFSLPDATTATNVGTGTGLVFKNLTGVTLNFRSLLAGTHLNIVSNTDDVTFTTDATNINTASAIVSRDASGNFAAGTITASLTGAASLNVLKAGDIMTGALQLPAGTTALPSLIFTGSTTSGLSANSDALSFSTNALERLKISSAGTVSLNAFNSAGVVHNDTSGNLSSSLIVNADISASAGIVDTKLATISTAGKVANSATTATSANTANAIVARDASGNFSAGSVSFVDAVIDNLTISNCIASACITALSITDASLTGTLSVNDEVLNGTLQITPFNSAGVVHNDTSGNLSSSLIVNADISASAGIVDTKLATISTAGKVANSATTATSANTANGIVARDASGNFSAGIISITDGVTNGNLVLSTEPSTSTAGNVIKGSSRFIHDFGVNNTFIGINAGNFTMTGVSNSGFGLQTLMNNELGSNNTAVGTNSLFNNTDGNANIAIGDSAMVNNTIGNFNTAVGNNALAGNLSGNQNVAMGNLALTSNATGGQNVALGIRALQNNITDNNTAIGYRALVANTTGSLNIALGYQAGQTLTIGSGNIYIDADAATNSESSTMRIGTLQTSCYIAGITGTGVSGDGVVVDSNGQLGITLSSKRFKHNIASMGNFSENIFKLRPVTFIYNGDESNSEQYGLIAEEVDEIFPAIVAKDEDGLPYTVRYHLLPVLLLHELQKQQKTIEEIKQLYVTKEDMNNIINSLQEQMQVFIEQIKDKEKNA